MRTWIAWPFETARSGRSVEDWNSNVCSVVRRPGCADTATCGRIIELAEGYPAEAGRMADGQDHRRRNIVRWLAPDDRSEWVYELMRAAFEEANRSFGFQLTGFAEPLQFIDYGREGHIDWHLDCTRRETSTRKLVATLLLSDPAHFSGGELEFCAMAESLEPPVKGETLVFPAFLPHRVTRVRRGRRRVLVAWAHGPAFR